VSLEEGGGIMTSAKTSGDVEESRDCCDEDAEVGDGQSKQVDIHDTLQIWPGEDYQAEEVAHDTHAYYQVSHHRVGNPFYGLHYHSIRVTVFF